MANADSSVAERLALVGGIGLVLPSRLLLQLGLRRRIDGWRRATGLLLREEAATFVLSAFSLDLWSDVEPQPASPDVRISQTHLIERLAKFLAGERDACRHVRRGRYADRAERCDSPSYTVCFQPWVEGVARFIRPDRWTENAGSSRAADGATDVLFNIVCRLHPNNAAVDVWVRANHIAIDGVPVQDLVSRLETAWGSRGPVVYPTPEEFAPFNQPRECCGRSDLVEVQDFVDFAPLLAWRQRENARLPRPMTISAALLWHLGQHPKLAPVLIGTTIEIPAIDGLERGVGVVVVRSSDYTNENGGLAKFVADFNRELDLTKQRRSGGCQTLDAAARLPASCETALLRHALRQGGRAFGSMGLTMIREAKVFGAPMGDMGHNNGFIAIGSVALPTCDSRRVGCVTIKGPAGRIAAYPALLREVIAACGA